jgi:demethylmenaquinone methyltransferase / 2-methoxy-6-polyprenyl-1,4-benzoquinol methylase
MADSKTIVPDYNSTDTKKQQVAGMFNRIAPKYDFLNHALSLNIDKIWRRKVIKIITQNQPERILDVATGTADLAIAASKKTIARIDGIDISEEMLRIGVQKIEKLGKDQQIKLQKADAENIPFAEQTFDAVMVAFGVRNFENLEAGLTEMYRVLKPGGICVVLEFTMPRYFPVKQLYLFYFRFVLPSIGRIISKDKTAYTYLPESVKAFPQRQQFTALMQNAGMNNTSIRNLSLGIAAIYTGTKAN